MNANGWRRADKASVQVAEPAAVPRTIQKLYPSVTFSIIKSSILCVPVPGRVR